MDRFFKLFFATSVPFGILMGLYCRSFIVALFSGTFFGFFMTIAFRKIEDLSLKKIGKDSSDVGVQKEKSFSVSLSKAEANKKIKIVLNEMHAEIINEDSGSGIIKAKTKISWKSFGEIITIRFSENGKQVTVFVESRPLLGTTLVDYGKNLQNVEKFAKLMIS